MRFSTCTFLVVAVLGLGPLPVPAAEKPNNAPEFPEVGSKIPGSFAPLVINGTWKDLNDKSVDRRHSLVNDFGLKPAVLVFARGQTDAALFNLLKKIDGKIKAHQDVYLRGGAVFLAFDNKRKNVEAEAKELTEDDAKELIKLANAREALLSSLKEKTQGLKNLRVAIDSPNGPARYEKVTRAYLTVLLYDKFTIKSVLTFAKTDLDESDEAAVVKTTAKILAAIDRLAAAVKKKDIPVKKE